LTFSVGENVGPYRILEQLGRGGMATVFKAYHPALDRYVALKVLHPAFKEDPNFLGRFEREARLVARLEHPNIVPTYDYAEHEGHPYLVMKYIEGETLKARLRKGPLNTDDILKITHAVGEALTYAHKKGILHRDVKPSNVLLSSDGEIYLADFGLARLAAVTDSTLSAEVLIGTPQYISPEQAGGNKDADERSDVYCFGVMLYELTVGRVPFNADTPYAIVFDHIYKPLPLPRTIKPAISEELEAVLLKALAKEREDRYPDVASLVKAFTNALSAPAAGTVAGTTTPPAATAIPPAASTLTPQAVPPVTRVTATEKKKPPRRGGRPWWVIGAWIALGLILLVGFLFMLRSIRRWSERNAAEVMPPLATSIAAFTPPVELLDMPVLAMVDEALVAFQNNKMEDFWGMLQAVEGLAGERADIYRQAGEQMAEEQAFLPAAIYYLQVFRYNPSILKPEQAIRMRQIIFQQAKNKEIGRIFEGNRDDPLYLIVLSRYEVFFKTDLADAKQRMGNLINDPKIVAAYPEAKLVMAEIYLKSNDPENARRILNTMVDDPALPGWVRDEARNLLNNIK
jgi:hypothetical protein